MPRIGVVGLLIALLLAQPIANTGLPMVEEVQHSKKSSGVDLRATDVSIRYSNPSDESQFKMFSSNHPILGFDHLIFIIGLGILSILVGKALIGSLAFIIGTFLT